MANKNAKIHKHPKHNTNGFRERPQDAGRHPLTVTDINNQMEMAGYKRVTAPQVAHAYELMMGLDEAEMQAKVNDKTIPFLYRIVIKSMLSGKGFDIIERMIDRAQGKALQRESHEGEVTVKFPAMTKEELKKAKDDLERSI